MANSDSGMAAVGVGSIGFGVLLIWSAYTRKPLFGPDGAIRGLISTGDLSKASENAGKAIGSAAGSAANKVGGATGKDKITPNDKPPGSEGIWI